MAIGETAREQAPPERMKWIPHGRFLMGSEDFYREEAPVREVEVDGFWMAAVVNITITTSQSPRWP